MVEKLARWLATYKCQWDELAEFQRDCWRQDARDLLSSLEAEVGPLYRQSDVQGLVEAGHAILGADGPSGFAQAMRDFEAALAPFTTTPNETPSTESGGETDG